MKGVEFPISDIVVKLFGLSAASDLKSRCFGRLPKRGYANSIVDLFPGGAMRFLSLIDGLDLQFPQIVVTQNGSSSEIKRTKDGHINKNSLWTQVNEGESLILNQVDRYDDKCSEVASALSNAMGQYVNANAYISKQGSGGFSTHFDTHDVIVVQIHGRKLWDIFAPPPSLRRFPTKADKLLDLNILESLPIKQIELTEGQTLYLPRGYPHKASAQDCDSVHVTFGLTPITIKGVFQQIIDRAFDDHEDIRGSAFELPYSDNLIASNVEMISKTLNSLMSSERILNSLAELQVDRRDSHTDGEKFKSLFG